MSSNSDLLLLVVSLSPIPSSKQIFHLLCSAPLWCIFPYLSSGWRVPFLLPIAVMVDSLHLGKNQAWSRVAVTQCVVRGSSSCVLQQALTKEDALKKREAEKMEIGQGSPSENSPSEEKAGSWEGKPSFYPLISLLSESWIVKETLRGAEELKTTYFLLILTMGEVTPQNCRGQPRVLQDLATLQKCQSFPQYWVCDIFISFAESVFTGDLAFGHSCCQSLTFTYQRILYILYELHGMD